MEKIELETLDIILQCPYCGTKMSGEEAWKEHQKHCLQLVGVDAYEVHVEMLAGQNSWNKELPAFTIARVKRVKLHPDHLNEHVGVVKFMLAGGFGNDHIHLSVCVLTQEEIRAGITLMKGAYVQRMDRMIKSVRRMKLKGDMVLKYGESH